MTTGMVLVTDHVRVSRSDPITSHPGSETTFNFRLDDTVVDSRYHLGRWMFSMHADTHLLLGYQYSWAIQCIRGVYVDKKRKADAYA
jgi:hypothetical protein